jgi:hypothetical protein
VVALTTAVDTPTTALHPHKVARRRKEMALVRMVGFMV